jgi:hypothetical protein
MVLWQSRGMQLQQDLNGIATHPIHVRVMDITYDMDICIAAYCRRATFSFFLFSAN